MPYRSSLTDNRHYRTYGKEQLEGLVDAQRQRDPLKLVIGERTYRAALPFMISRGRHSAEQHPLLIYAEAPFARDVEECAQPRPRQALSDGRVMPLCKR